MSIFADSGKILPLTNKKQHNIVLLEGNQTHQPVEKQARQGSENTPKQEFSNHK